MKNVISQTVGVILFAPIAIISICLFILVFSMVVDSVTGFDLIREVIRPSVRELRQ